MTRYRKEENLSRDEAELSVRRTEIIIWINIFVLCLKDRVAKKKVCFLSSSYHCKKVESKFNKKNNEMQSNRSQITYFGKNQTIVHLENLVLF